MAKFGLLLWPCLSFAAPDLATKKGMATTCTALPADARALRNNAERQAFAVCHDIALLQQIIRRIQGGMKEFNRGPDPDNLRTKLPKEFPQERFDFRVSAFLYGLVSPYVRHS